MKEHAKHLNNVTVRKFLFYSGYSLFIISFMLKRVIPLAQFANIASNISFVVLAIASCISLFKMPKKKAFLIIILGLMAILTKVNADTYSFLIIWLLIIASKGITFDSTVRLDLIIKIPLLFIIPLCYFGGLTEVNLHYRDGIIRHSMGFSNPNIFSTLIMSVVAETLYLRREKLGSFDLLFSVAAIFVVNYYADSRTQMLCIIAMAISLYVWKILNKRKQKHLIKNWRLITLVIDYSFSILLFISLIISSLYLGDGLTSSPISILNDVTSGRLKAASKMLEKYEMKPFGQEIEIISKKQASATGKKVQTLDNVYIYMILAIGVIPTIVYCYFMKVYMQYTNKNCKALRYIMLVYIIGGLMEHFIIEPQFNLFLLYFAYMIYGNPEIIPKKLKSENAEE